LGKQDVGGYSKFVNILVRGCKEVIKLIRLGWVETFNVANMPNFVANLAFEIFA